MINKFGADSRNFFFWHFLFIIGDPHNHFIGRLPDFCGRPKAFHRIIGDPKFFIGNFQAYHQRLQAPHLETQAYHQRPQTPHWRHKFIIRDPKLIIGDPSLSSDPKLLIGDPSLSSETPSSSLETQAYHQRPQTPH